MVKCTTCGMELKKGTGTMYVFKTGELNYLLHPVLQEQDNPQEEAEPQGA